MTMIDTKILTDMVVALPNAVRLQELVSLLRTRFHAGAVVLLHLDNDYLRPVAVDGLVPDVLGRRFKVANHPRLAAILARSDTCWFEPDSTLPDPYDGLLDSHIGAPLQVHDCMGINLSMEGRLWGVLTLDALEPGVFDQEARALLNRYQLLIEAAIRMTHLEEEAHRLRLTCINRDLMHTPPDLGSYEILGQSPQIMELLQEIRTVSCSDLPVLLLGETGVGKELFARQIHHLSQRATQPLIHVNCAALPDSLIESELFGHVRGAFSGASTDRLGRFEAASGGTLLLDEIGELPLQAQAKMLRALQNGEIQRVGQDHPHYVDVRIIAATNRDLKENVKRGTFRADLYHRLSVYPINIPPLRERGNDVLLLAGYFLELNRSRLGLRSLRLSPAAETTLRQYDWPGNVRELEHIVSRAALKAVSRGAKSMDIVTLEPHLLDLDMGHPIFAPDPAPASHAHTQDTIRPLKDALEACQHQCITEAIAITQGNWAEAARHLSLDPSNLHKMARRLGIK